MTAGSPGARAYSDGRMDRSHGRAGTTPPARRRSPAPAPLRHSTSPPHLTSHWCAWPPIASAARSTPPPNRSRRPSQAYPAGLTQREVDVLRLLARHQTDKEIAEALFVGPRTVQTHVANILNKLGVENRRAAAAEAARLGLV